MKKRMDELIRETFVLDAPKLCCSVSEISIMLGRNECSEGSLTFSSEDGGRIRGTVFTDNRRIKISEPEISGSPCVVAFTVDSTGLNYQDQIEGSITARTSLGEMKIPVKAVVTDKRSAEAGDEVKALEHFSRLAQTSPAKAFRFFISEEFSDILNGKNIPYRTLYRGLSQNPVTYQHMEEFLVATGKKEQVRISVDKRDVNSYKVSASLKDTIYIYKSTWGYCRIDIRIIGDFIETEKLQITSDDFIGKVYGLEFIINRERVGTVPKVGKIILETPYEKIEVNIEAVLDGGVALLSGTFRKRKTAELMRKTLDLYLHRMDYRTWYESAMQLIRDMKEEKEDGLTLFGEACLAYCNDDNNRAIELLWKVKNGEYTFEHVWERAAYQYLSKVCGILPAEKNDIAPKLRAYYQRDPSCYLILALFIKVDEEPPYRAVWGLNEFEKASEAGCISPFLYLRAYREIEKTDLKIRSLSSFILRVLLFADRQGILSKDIMKKTAFLAESDVKFRPAVYRLLKNGYEKYPDDELLAEICKYIAKDDPSRPRYHEWYDKAVRADLRVQGLYEYYMITRDASDTSELPAQVKLYFRKNQRLSEEKKANLYALIIRHKAQDPQTYKDYREEMEAFASGSIAAGKITEDLSVLYNEFILPKKDLEAASALARVAFTNSFHCSDPDIRYVVVCHSSLKDETRYEIQSGKAYPNIYGPDACVLVEDNQRRRFAVTIPFELKPLMNVKKIARACIDLGVWDTGLQLYCCHERGWQMDVNSRTVLNFLMAAENPGFTRKHRDMLRRKLLVYFSRNTEDPYAHKFAEKIKEGTYGWVDKERTFDLLCEFSLYSKAVSLMEKLGFEGLDPEKMLKAADDQTFSHNYEASEILSDLCMSLFREGRFTERTLKYLARYFDGSLEEMILLWRQAQRGDAGCEKLEERILITSMFTRTLPESAEEILEDYAIGGANAAVMRAFLSFIGDYYLLENRPVGALVAERFSNQCNLKDGHMRIIMLAWLKYLSEQDEIPAKEMARVRKLMKNCNEDGLRFNFMKKLTEKTGDNIDIANRTIIEERFPCGCSAVIHYRTREGEFRTEPMKERIKGLFTKEFLLFCGEKLEYYFTVKPEGAQSYDTEILMISPEVSREEGTTRYDIINRLIGSIRSGEEEKAAEAAREYLKQEACAERFFDILT